MRLELAALAFSCAAIASAQRSCNGSPALCDRLYSKVTFVGAHDSSFVGILPVDNQYISVADQLNMGVRFLQSQTHKKNNDIQMCHTSCDLEDAGTLAEFLAPVRSFLDSHPNEVVTLLLTNGDTIPVSQFGDVFKAAGLDSYAFTPTGQLALDDWPTLGSLIDQGKRLVVLMDYHSDTAQIPYILDEFAYYFENLFDSTDPNFNECALDRPSGGKPDGHMYIMNHMLHVELDIFGQKIQIPDQIRAMQTNSVDSITKQGNLCNSIYGRLPNVVLLDFINIGNAMGAQNRLNGV